MDNPRVSSTVDSIQNNIIRVFRGSQTLNIERVAATDFASITSKIDHAASTTTGTLGSNDEAQERTGSAIHGQDSKRGGRRSVSYCRNIGESHMKTIVKTSLTAKNFELRDIRSKLRKAVASQGEKEAENKTLRVRLREALLVIEAQEKKLDAISAQRPPAPSGSDPVLEIANPEEKGSSSPQAAVLLRENQFLKQKLSLHENLSMEMSQTVVRLQKEMGDRSYMDDQQVKNSNESNGKPEWTEFLQQMCLCLMEIAQQHGLLVEDIALSELFSEVSQAMIKKHRDELPLEIARRILAHQPLNHGDCDHGGGKDESASNADQTTRSCRKRSDEWADQKENVAPMSQKNFMSQNSSAVRSCGTRRASAAMRPKRARESVEANTLTLAETQSDSQEAKRISGSVGNSMNLPKNMQVLKERITSATSQLLKP